MNVKEKIANRIVDFLKDQEWASPAEVWEIFQEDGCQRSFIKSLMKEMIEKGTIKYEDGFLLPGSGNTGYLRAQFAYETRVPNERRWQRMPGSLSQ